ncbi:MAG: radical SAM protein, partial [Armatimonadetes bacterium]|nr:radical SAM protein [Armatimonadota bacterium]
LDDLPTVEERLPFIRQSAFLRGRPYFASSVPLLASTGCPYSCDFCIDWSSKYRVLPLERLKADIDFLAKHYPGVMVSFHDPNLAAGWDTVLDLLEQVPAGSRSPTVVESSLASLKSPDRLRRIRDTRCAFIGVGIESWAGYSRKAGVGAVEGAAKVPLVVEQMRTVAEYVPYLQANFVFGLDVDEGDEPVEATKEFMSQAPFAWPAINIPQPFGNTPLHAHWLAEGRLLTTMPFYFYQMPYLVTIPKHYDPMTYYAKMFELQAHATSLGLLRRRLATTSHRLVQAMHITRTFSIRRMLATFRHTLESWKRDRQLLAFHCGETTTLPEVYEGILRRSLGRFAPLLSRADLTPLTPAVG